MSYIARCPSCGANKNDISMFASYFDVWQCDDCGYYYCHHCRNSNHAKQCPKCGSQKRSKHGVVSK